MTTVKLAMALLFGFVLATGCTAYFFKVTDTSSGRVYYTTDVAHEPNNVRFKDAKTGQEVVIPNARVESIPQNVYQAGVAGR